MSQYVRVDEDLWGAAVAPEGILEWWFHSDGAEVAAGDKLAEIQIEGASHDIVAPVAGKLQVLTFAGSVVDPGCVIGRVC
jgi:pyruvate/2-oxoglutarate dehydrogenase complex dihydrolipoamide acyltransferase (E2) component